MSAPLAAARHAPAPPANQRAALRRAYQAEGYAVVRDLVPGELCERVRAAFAAEVKPYRGALYRQTRSGDPERHVFTERGHLLNPILNIQSRLWRRL